MGTSGINVQSDSETKQGGFPIEKEPNAIVDGHTLFFPGP